MHYAMFVKVRIVPGRYEDSLEGLSGNVVPVVKGAPGFLKGTWFGDSEAGHGLVLFTTEEQARQAASMVTAGPDDPIQIESVTVYEVHAEA